MSETKENNNLTLESSGFTSGAQPNNKNAKKGKLFYHELRKALVQNDQLNLRQIADKLVEKAIEGEPWAVKEIMDRVDGKSVQTTEVSGIDGDAVELKLIEFIIKHPE